MQPPRAPVFLARDTYRRRRLTDGLRLLPVIGLIVFFSPLVGGSGYVRSTASSGLWIFGAWVALIFATWLLGRLLARAPGGGGDPLETGSGAGPEGVEPLHAPPPGPSSGPTSGPPAA